MPVYNLTTMDGNITHMHAHMHTHTHMLAYTHTHTHTHTSEHSNKSPRVVLFTSDFNEKP